MKYSVMVNGNTILDTDSLEAARAKMYAHNDSLGYDRKGRSKQPEFTASITYNEVREQWVQSKFKPVLERNGRVMDHIEGFTTDGRVNFKRDHGVSIAEQVRNRFVTYQMCGSLDKFGSVY